jgi:hypothetical protein
MRRLVPWALVVGVAGAGILSPARTHAQAASTSRVAPPPASRAGANHAHAFPSPTVRAARAGAITLDGTLDDPAWAAVEPATDFRQQEPRDGEPATQRTEIRLLFDEDALYIGARMFDSLGAAGVRGRLVRRDQFTDTDWIQFVFDTYHNHLGRTIFEVNPSGVRRDAGQATEFTDQSWDPIWEARTAIDSLGWTAELRIPFSQLRFSQDSVQTWGMQVWRTVSRINEISMWSYWGRNEPGGPQRFGHVEGLEVNRGARRLEVLPYVVGRASFLQPGDPGNPFYDRETQDTRIGGDVKYLLTSNLTLDATINPDFGQVEVDPAVVNLSAFETFFSERRPFFVAGSGVFGFGSFSCYFCSNVSSMSLFYSRRIGRTPQGALPSGTEYVDAPNASTILGAAKVTGRTRSGVTVGMLNALTDRERAPIILNGTPARHEVEPRTNYFVGRVRKDFNRGNLEIGSIATSVYRFTNEALILDSISRHAEALGFDWNARWNNRTYQFMGNFALSNVEGEASAIDRLQKSSARYFNRPDRQQGGNGLFSDRYDPAATRLRGFGGYSRMAKTSGNWLWETAVNYRSPGFEVNDLAFNTRSDYFWMNANLFRTFRKPTALYRQLDFIVGAQQQYNFDGDMTDRQMQLWSGTQLRNYWWISGFVFRRTDVHDDRLLRGGPVVRRPGMWYTGWNIDTDSRKPVVVGFYPYYYKTDDGYSSYSLQFNVRTKPASNIDLAISPYYSKTRSSRQYVRAVTDPTAVAFYGRRYLFADLDQQSFGFDTRLNVTFSPELTLELYAQPFISSADYARFKEIAAPRSQETVVFGEDAGTVTPVENAGGEVSRYDIDPDGAGPAPLIQLQNPNFNLSSLRGNAVLRWEYRPGSTLFLVWTRQGSDFTPFTGDLRLSRDLDRLFDAETDNVFLVKLTYWLNR